MTDLTDCQYEDHREVLNNLVLIELYQGFVLTKTAIGWLGLSIGPSSRTPTLYKCYIT